jgi:endo-1,4-beta-xylanase
VQFLRSNIDDGQYAATLKANYSLVEPENDLKPPAIWKGIGQYDFTNPDFLLGAPGEKGWAARNGLAVRGHVLVYARDDGYTIPGWLIQMEKQITPDQAKQILHDYIFAVAGRYKGKIAMWDVVNEAIDEHPNDRPLGLRDSFWFRKLGPDFLVLAFQYAHEADPKAELYYNEFGVESGGEKTKHLLELVHYIRDHGGPITGVGLQYHSGLWEHIVPGDGHFQLLDQLKHDSFAFMITELDIGISVQPLPRDNPDFGCIPATPDLLDKQASLYGDIFKLATSYPNCHGIQMWGFTDKHSWISMYSRGQGAALPFDDHYQPKPALGAIEQVLKDSHR